MAGFENFKVSLILSHEKRILKFEFRLNCKQRLMFYQGPISDNNASMPVDAVQFCLRCKNPMKSVVDEQRAMNARDLLQLL